MSGDGALVVPNGVSLAGRTMSGNGWVVTMVPGTPPTFSCGPVGTVAASTTTTTMAEASTTTTTTTVAAAMTTTTIVSNGVTIKASVAGDARYYGERILTLTNSSAITAMTATISVQQTAGVSYHGAYTNFWGGTVGISSSSADGFIVYTFSLLPVQTVVAGTWKLDGQWSGTGSLHPTTGDTWRVTTTSQGRTSTATGTF